MTSCRRRPGSIALSTQSKHFIDTIKNGRLPRGKTAMAQILRRKMTRHDDARSLLRAVYNTEVDINPDIEAKTLTIPAPSAGKTTLRTKPSDISATNSTAPRRSFPAQKCA